MPVQQQSLTGDHTGTADCPDLWELPAIGLEAALDRGLTGAGAPVVAIQDSGFLESHVDFGAVSGRYDYGNSDGTPEVEWSAGIPQHGTFIAGIVNGRADNGVGRGGVMPAGRVNLQKIMDDDGALYYSYAVSAMADIAEGDLGVRVLNYSLASGSHTTAFAEAVAALGDADILLVAAAANCSVADCAEADNDAYPVYPASFPDEHILAVAGSRRDGGLNSYSHYGAWSVDLAAPGVDLCSLAVDDSSATATAAGTSYATPLVAAAAALLWEAAPSLTAVEVARVLRVSAAPHPELTERVRSGGALDLARALQVAVPRLGAPPDPIAFEGHTTVGIDLSNVAEAGTAAVVLTHGAGLHIELGLDAPADWSVTRFAPGDRIELPDAGSHIAEGTGTVLSGSLPAHTAWTLSTVWSAVEDGESDVTVRLVATSPGADWLNAPYNTGTKDETGFLAESTHASWRAADPEGGTDTGEEPFEDGDSAPDPGSDDTATMGPGGGTGAKGQGGCAVTVGGGWAAVLLSLLGVACRRSAR